MAFSLLSNLLHSDTLQFVKLHLVMTMFGMFVLLALRSGIIGLFEYLPCKEQVYAFSSVLIHLHLLFVSQLQIYTTIHTSFLYPHEAVLWALISKLRIICYNSKFFIAHSLLLVVLAGHSPFLKVSKSS